MSGTSQRELLYTYDINNNRLRPTVRTAAQVNSENYTYAYDNIGDRTRAQEAAAEVTQYASNELNQYTSVGTFTPEFDPAGYQTLVKTSAGIWRITYNAENRPISFVKEDGSTVVECAYDYMGRRSYKKVTTNGKVTLHQRYLYRGYLQIAACDLTRATSPCLWLILWDPTQTVATRPLAIQKDGTWYTYGWDLTKNICEVYGQSGYIRTLYTYTPYGAVTADGDVTQPIQWSSEFYDDEVGLVYYNYRYYNALEGRWLCQDPLVTVPIYRYIRNMVTRYYDDRGLLTIGIDGTNYNTEKHSEQRSNVSNIIDNIVDDETRYYGGPGSNDPDEWNFSDITGSALSNDELGFAEIRDKVYADICSEYRKNKNISINMFGWSRGGVIAVEVAKLLNDKGCCVKTYDKMVKSWNPLEDWKTEKRCCKYDKPINVNFIGLFDPVDMALFNMNTSKKPDNVGTLYSIQSNSRKGKEQILFPPQGYDGEDRDKVRRNHDGTRTSHGDIGGTKSSRPNDAYDRMKERAQREGVNIR